MASVYGGDWDTVTFAQTVSASGHEGILDGKLYLNPADFFAEEGYIATDNGTLLCDLYSIIDCEYTDLDELKDDIDRLLQGVDPTYDANEGLGNAVVLIMGIMGMIMIPASFMMLKYQISAGEWTQGFYYLLMMFFVGLGFVTVWLFG